MIEWLQPQALWGTLAAAGVVVVHLLFRARRTRVLFPSLRFVRSSSMAAVRLRHPADLILLAVRMAILLLAALALAQPLLVTEARLRAWNGRIARAIVVDASAGMRPAAADAAAMAASESAAADRPVTIEAADLAAGIRQAVHWIETAPPGRREIVVVSNFRLGALSARDVEGVPSGVGIRFATVGALPAEREFGGNARFAGDTIATTQVRLSGPATSVDVGPVTGVAAGLEIVVPRGSEPAVPTLRRVVAAAGAPAPSSREPIVVALDGATPSGAIRPIAAPWMLSTIVSMQRDAELVAVADGAIADAVQGAWIHLVKDRAGKPLVRAAAAGDSLLIDVAAAPSDLLAAAAVRSALVSRIHLTRDDQEVMALPHADLAKWSRPAAPAGRDGWRQSESSDARWCWGAVLLLLGAETLLRRRQTKPIEVMADAA